MPTFKPSQLANFLSTWRGHCLILALSAVVMVLPDKLWPSPAGGTIDPWVYYGYFWDYPSYVTRFFPDTYYGTRLPWILPGYVAVHMFPAMIGTFIFVLAVYYAAVYSFYALTTLLFNRHVGFLCTLFFASDFYFLRSIAWYYVDGGVILYFIFTLLLLTLAHRYPRRIFLFLAGWSCTSMLLCHLLSVVLVPGLVAYLAYSQRSAPHWKGRTSTIVRFVLLGGFCCVVFFDIINFSVTHSFFFFMPQLNVLFATGSIVAKYKVPLTVWLRTAWWDIIPGLSILLGLIAVFLQRRRDAALHGIQAMALFSSVGTLLMLLVLESAGLFYYQISYYTSFLLPLCYLIIGATIYTVTRDKPLAGYLTVPFVFLVYWARTRTDFRVGELLFPNVRWAYLALCVVLVSTAALLLPFPWKSSRTRSLLFVLGLGACGLGVGQRGFFGPRQDWELLQQTHGRIESIAGPREPRLWYSSDEHEVFYWRSLSSMYLWGYSIVNESYPSAASTGFNSIRDGDLLVVCSESPELKEEARQALVKKSIRWDQIRKERVTQGDMGFWIIIGEAHGGQPSNSRGSR